MKPIEPLALRPQDAAKALGISPRTLWALTVPRGPIPCVRLGNSVRYCPDALRRFLTAKTEVSPE